MSKTWGYLWGTFALAVIGMSTFLGPANAMAIGFLVVLVVGLIRAEYASANRY